MSLKYQGIPLGDQCGCIWRYQQTQILAVRKTNERLIEVLYSVQLSLKEKLVVNKFQSATYDSLS